MKTLRFVGFLQLLVLAGFGTGVYAQRPLDNSPASIALHGVVNDGKTVNRIKVKGVELVFPAGIRVVPLTPHPEKIVKGQAHKATVALIFPEFRSPPEAEAQRYNEYKDGVRIEFRSDMHENPGALNKYLESRKWESIAERPDLGLRVYLRSDGGWGGLTYVPLSTNARTPGGGPLQFRCDYVPAQPRPPKPSRCRSGYSHSSGVFVHYVFAGPLIRHWREVELGVRRFADSVIMGGK
jgi:hypothetical protein